MYFEYMVEFHELHKQFATGKRMLKFGGVEAVGDGPAAWMRYQSQLEKLLELRNKVDLLSGRRMDKRMVDASYAISRMLEVDSDESATPADWDQAELGAKAAMLGMRLAMRTEMHVANDGWRTRRRIDRVLRKLPEPSGRFDPVGSLRSILPADTPIEDIRKLTEEYAATYLEPAQAPNRPSTAPE